MTDDKADYVLPRTEQEYQRLLAQASLWQPATAAVLDRIGVRPGWRCLDVGCGPGAVMRLVGERVGPTGAVTGIDADTVVGTRMEQDLRRDLDATVRFVGADVTTLAEAPDGPYDLIHARLLMLHLQDPVALIRTLRTWLRPGGVLLLQEYDASPMALHPSEPAWEEISSTIVTVFDQGNRGAYAGTQLPAYLRAAGLPDPETDVSGLLLRIDRAGGMIQSTFGSVLPAAAKLGLITPERGAELITTIDGLERERAHHVAFPNLVSAWTTAGD